MKDTVAILGAILAAIGALLLLWWAAGTCQFGGEGVCDISDEFTRYVLPRFWDIGVALLAIGILLLTLRVAFRRISRRSVLSGRI